MPPGLCAVAFAELAFGTPDEDFDASAVLDAVRSLLGGGFSELIINVHRFIQDNVDECEPIRWKSSKYTFA